MLRPECQDHEGPRHSRSHLERYRDDGSMEVGNVVRRDRSRGGLREVPCSLTEREHLIRRRKVGRAIHKGKDYDGLMVSVTMAWART